VSLVVVGSVALDTVTAPAGSVRDALGGSAVFFATAASLFCPVGVVGVVGDDFPEAGRRLLADRGVDLEGLETVKGGATFRWEGVYHDDLNQRDTISTELGVFETFEPKLPDSYKATQVAFLANIDPKLQLRVLDQLEAPRFVACDTMNLWIDIARDSVCEVLGRVDGVIINDQEAKQLTGLSDTVRAARAVAEMGPRVVAVKKGEHGCLLLADGAWFAGAALPLENVVDPTGAGDTFAGGFMGYLAGADVGDPAAFRRAVAYGTVLASFACEGFSLEGLVPVTREDVEARLAEYARLISLDG